MSTEMKEFNEVLGQISSAYHDVCLKFGMADSDFDILYAIGEHGEGCCQAQICKTLGQKKSTINSSLKKMERNGYLYLQKGEGRNTKVYLTDAGRELSRSTAERIIRIEIELFSSWSEEERRMMIALNRKYLNDFRERIEREVL